MSLVGQSNADRIFRIANAILTGPAPVPWLGAVAVAIKELYDLVERFKTVKPTCKGLVDDVINVANSLDVHHNAHSGNSKLEDAKNMLTRIVAAVKADFLRWKNFRSIQTFFRMQEILDKIESYRGELNRAVMHLMFTAALNQDVESAKREREMQVVRGYTEKILKRIEEGAQETAAIKEFYKTAKLQKASAALKAAEDRIIELRLDDNPDSFPSEDMLGEVKKEGPDIYCYGHTFDVFKAKWVNRGWVAAKRFKGRDWTLSETEERRFKRQVNIWRTLKHPNILPLLGVCKFEENMPLYLISPWMKYENVKRYLAKFPEADKLGLTHEVALGLQYLHSVAILHGNLNGSNVLVDAEHRVRLTGFSLSKEIEEDTRRTTSNNNSELFRWWSPEALLSQRLSEQSDIWSFGMTALEILSGVRPYKDDSCALTARDAIVEYILPEPEDYEEEIATESIWALMRRCWEAYGSRPEIDDVVSVLHEERIKKGWNPDAPAPERTLDSEFPLSF
ncbi:hypothetical protein FS837_010903 [Tulasnella sp. UAMH 9824]|nr:hypothetical protein FS837_010903 [Tulasnella sp. UAMH 9824]